MLRASPGARVVAVARLVIAALLLGGCAASSIPRPQVPGDAPVELADTPFFSQRTHHCGPAALATVLGATEVSVHPDALAPLLYVPGRQGSLQVELAAVPRRYDRLAVPIAGSLDAIVDQLVRGRPVLVLQNLALERWPRWHYAVVVGYLPDEDRFVLRSGGEARLQVSRARFLATWIRAGRWAIVVLPPDAAPEGLDASAYLKAAAALESAGRHAAALAAFESALTVWPQQSTAALGRANNLYLLGRGAEAEIAYGAVLDRAPGHPVALHNLAALLVEQGRACAARALLPAPTPGEPAVLTAARTATDEAVAAQSGGRGCP